MKHSILFSALASLAVTGNAIAAETVEPSRPNILYIMADDLGYGDLSCMGATKFKTPSIDSIAQEGIRFSDAHSPHSVCTPTRYAVLTGRYAWRGRLKSKVLWSSYDPILIEKGRKTIGNMMQELGYHTAFIGKWHLGWGDKGDTEHIDFTKKGPWRGPNDIGFDYSFTTPTAKNFSPYCQLENHVSISKLIPNPDTSMSKFYKKHNPPEYPDLVAVDWDPAVVDENNTKKTIAFLEKHKAEKGDQPFYIHLNYEAPHKPHNVPKRFQGASGISEHVDQILYLDEQVGLMLKTLEELGYKENTLVLFTSDNGAEPDATGSKNGHKTNGPLNGHKRSILEGGHRVPLLARWPGKIKPGITSSAFVSLSDIMATYAAITGYQLSNDMGEDSFNVLPAFFGSNESPRTSMIHQDITGTLGIRDGKWKYVPAARKTKLADGARFALFDMEKDWCETTNLIQKYPEVVNKLKAELKKQKAAGRTVPERNK